MTYGAKLPAVSHAASLIYLITVSARIDVDGWDIWLPVAFWFCLEDNNVRRYADAAVDVALSAW